MADRGNLFVVAAPSGAGKTSLVKALVSSLQNIQVSISHTTRPQRPGEQHGINYYFIDHAQFEQEIAEGQFLEYATIFGNYYGTSKSWVETSLMQGKDVILEIDWQGYQQIKAMMPAAIGIFVLPPSLTALSERLVGRQQDSEAVIAERLADAKATIAHVYEFDYVVVNDDFGRTLADLSAIVVASRLMRVRQLERFSSLIKELND